MLDGRCVVDRDVVNRVVLPNLPRGDNHALHTKVDWNDVHLVPTVEIHDVTYRQSPDQHETHRPIQIIAPAGNRLHVARRHDRGPEDHEREAEILLVVDANLFRQVLRVRVSVRSEFRQPESEFLKASKIFKQTSFDPLQRHAVQKILVENLGELDVSSPVGISWVNLLCNAKVLRLNESSRNVNQRFEIRHRPRHLANLSSAASVEKNRRL